MEKHVIYKYELPITQGRFEVKLPIGSKVLSIQRQKFIENHPTSGRRWVDKPFMWVYQSSDPEKYKVPYQFAAIYTGQETHAELESAEYLATVLIPLENQPSTADGKPLVIHYFAT